MINILISAIGQDIGQGILKSLRSSSRELKIIGADASPEAPGLFMCDKGYLVAPAKRGERYIRDIIKICQKEKINLVFSCHEKEQCLIAESLTKLEKTTGAYFVVQPKSVLLICQDKFKTYEFLKKSGVPVPESAADEIGASKLIEKYGFPVIIKSRSGSGGRNFHIVRNKEEFESLWLQTPDPLCQQYLNGADGEEYTVGVFLDRRSSLLGAMVMKRKMRDNITAHAIVDDFPDVMNVAIKAAVSVKAIGPCNVQLRRNSEGTPCVMEINARFSSSTVLRARLGYNEALAAVDYFFKNKKPNLKYKKGVAMRTYGDLIISSAVYEKLNKNKIIINNQAK